MAYAEKKPLCRRYGLRGMGNQRDGYQAPSTTVRQAPRTGEDTVYSPNKYRETEGRKDTTGYSVSGGKGQIAGTNDAGVAFTINNNATIIYQPGYWDNFKRHTSNDGFYNKAGTKVIPGPATVYTGTYHSGYLKFVVNGGAMTLDGDKGQRSIAFTAGSTPTVTANTQTKTVLAQSGSTAMQNFAFAGMEDL